MTRSTGERPRLSTRLAGLAPMMVIAGGLFAEAYAAQTLLLPGDQTTSRFAAASPCTRFRLAATAGIHRAVTIADRVDAAAAEAPGAVAKALDTLRLDMLRSVLPFNPQADGGDVVVVLGD